MHNLERQMFERFLGEKNYLSPNSNVIINDINKKVTPILNQFSFLEKIPTSYFRVHFNLILPSLSIEELYENLLPDHTIDSLSTLHLNVYNIKRLIMRLEPQLLELMKDYNYLYDSVENEYIGSKVIFSNEKIFVVKNNYIIDELFFGFVDPTIGYFIQNKLHYIHQPRKDTLLHLGFYNKKGFVLGYCSFSLLDRDYPLVAFQKNTKKESIINMTRAFAINNSPSNLIGGLFHKSYQYISKHYSNLKYIMTYINQNLGFSGSSFKGASYIPIGLSPMEYCYIDGIYSNRKGLLNKDLNSITYSKLAMLPIVLLARGLHKKSQIRLEKQINNIVLILKDDYIKG